MAWLTLHVCGPALGQGRYSRVPQYTVGAASCLVLGAQRSFDGRAGGPVLNRPLTNLCFPFHSFFPCSVLLLPEQISISSSPSLFPILHP
jgi:hypothetical protein